MRRDVKNYAIGILIPVAVGALSAFLTMGNMDTYEGIDKPFLSPPGIVFPIVWTILFILMGISSTIIYRSETADQKTKENALYIYGLQLVANFLWSLVFFNGKAYLLSFILLIGLWLLILAMILSFKKINKTAAFLQVPYLLWVAFAGYLNFMIYILNK